MPRQELAPVNLWTTVGGNSPRSSTWKSSGDVIAVVRILPFLRTARFSSHVPRGNRWTVLTGRGSLGCCELRGGRRGFDKDGRIKVERKIERRRVGPCMVDWADTRFEQNIEMRGS